MKDNNATGISWAGFWIGLGYLLVNGSPELITKLFGI